jgi:hypothetical protein
MPIHFICAAEMTALPLQRRLRHGNCHDSPKCRLSADLSRETVVFPNAGAALTMVYQIQYTWRALTYDKKCHFSILANRPADAAVRFILPGSRISHQESQDDCATWSFWKK